MTFAATGACSVAGNLVTIGGAGSCTVTASQAGSANYLAAVDVAQTFAIAKASQSITFGPLANKTFGDAPFAVSATGGASGNPVTFAASGACSVSANIVTIAGVGSCTVTASQAGNANCQAAADIPQSFSIAKGSSVVSWATPAPITFGTSLGAAQLNATASVVGSFLYNPAVGTVLAAGTQTLSVTFTPTDTNLSASSASVQIVVKQAVPAITWATPADITAGTPLGAVQLNATASVPGAFVYSPAAGTVLPAGNGQTLSAAFTPADAANYTSATASVLINVVAVAPPPPANPIVPILDQFNSEGDRVRLKVQLAPSDSPLLGTMHNDDNDADDCQARGVFNAMNLPPGLEIERKHGVIRGRIGFNAAGDYHVTVSFTRDGVTFTRSFTWHVADVFKRHRHDERDVAHYR